MLYRLTADPRHQIIIFVKDLMMKAL